MNEKLQEALKGFLFIDYEDFNAFTFNVIDMAGGKFNLILELFYVQDDDTKEDYGIVIRTAIYDDNLVDLAKKVKAIINIGLFDNLVFLQEASCLSVDAEEKYKFDWDDYISSTQMFIN